MHNNGEILSELLKGFKDCVFFLHNTKELSVAHKILREGFMFESQLSNSTDCINPDTSIETSYFFFQRKDYGKYTIVIAIPNAVYDMYFKRSNELDVTVESVMTISTPVTSDNDELVYTLSPKHILGYFDIEKSTFHKNACWDEHYSGLDKKR